MDFRGTGIFQTGGTQVPFQRSVDPAALGAFVNLEQRDMNRIKKYHEAWRFYMGQHWTYSREDGTPLYTDNVIKKAVDDNVTWLVGGGFTVQIPTYFADVVGAKLKETWEQTNDKMTVLLEAAQMASICGDAFIFVVPASPDRKMRNMNPYTHNFVRILVLNSESVFPVWDPKNTEILLCVKIVTLYVDPDTLDNQKQSGPPQFKKFIQVIYPNKIIEHIEGEMPEERINPLGEIPLVHIKNFGIGREYFGMSDMDAGVIDLQRELNEKGTDVSDTLNYHAHPITVVIGAKVKHLERGPKKVWSGFPVGSEVFNLEMGGGMEAATNYMDRIREAIREKTGEPKDVEVVPNTSAVALELQFLPMVKRLKRKRPYFEKGLRDINYFILRWFQVLEDLYLPYGFCENCGGRILETLVFDRVTQQPMRRPSGRFVTRRRCYHADILTGQLVDPEEMKLRVVRKLSKGSKREMMERWRIVAEMTNGRPSFWDPMLAAERTQKVESGETWEKETSKEKEEFQDQSADFNMTKPPAPPPPMPGEQPMLPEEPQTDMYDVDLTMVEIPPEPEMVRVLEPIYGQDGLPLRDLAGNMVTNPVDRYIVPTGCERPCLYNPMQVPMKLNDVLPRDESVDSALANQNLVSKMWSRERAMSKLGIENPQAEMEQIRQEEEEFGSVTAPEDVPRAPGQGMEAERAAMGGANKPKPPGAVPTFGKNQAKE